MKDHAMKNLTRLSCRVFQGQTCRRVGELSGHTASVTHLALDEKLNHVFSMSMDKIIKVQPMPENHANMHSTHQ